MTKVCVVGLGYIGLPTAAILASSKFIVHGVDINKDAVETINRGGIHIFEPDLEQLVKTAVNSGDLVADTVPTEADVFIIAVPTPFKENHTPDISYVESAVTLIAPYVRKGNLIVLESTSPVGTTERIVDWLGKLRPELFLLKEPQFQVAHCPERVLPGHILRELVENDRVIGGINELSAEQAKDFYKQFVKGQIVLTNARTAELAKLTENSFRDVNIAFANELSVICDKLDINVWELIQIANRHPRVNILQPGPGVGGHCIAVDPWFIVDAAQTEARMIRTAREINDNKPVYVVNKIKEMIAEIDKPRISIFGLAFKPDVDDLRESPSLEITEKLAEETRASLFIVEPFITELPSKLSHMDNVYLVNKETAVQEADLVVMLVNHKQFYQLDVNQLAGKMLVDTRGVWQEIIVQNKADMLLVRQ